MLRIVADANLYVSAVLSPSGNTAHVIEAARQGQVTLIMSDALCDELGDVLARDKFRRYLSEDQAADFVDAMTLLAEWAPDRPTAEIPQVCADPDDNYLVALYQDAEANLLVSGDKDVLAIAYPNVYVCTPRRAVELIAYRHEWGDGFMPGDPDAIRRQIDAEGHAALLNVFSAFSEIVLKAADREQAAEFLPFVTVPSAVAPFVEQFDQTRALLENRGLGTRPMYAAPDVAYLKLPPNPEVAIVAVGDITLPPDTIYVTLQRCQDLPDRPDLPFDHWRVFGIGQWPIEQIAPRGQQSVGPA